MASCSVPNRFREDIWDAYNDAGLVVVLCLKLEALLSELVAKFCGSKSADLAHYYHAEYKNILNIENTSGDFESKNYSAIIKNRCKITLESLIQEVFDPKDIIKKKWGSPATHFSLSEQEKSLLDKINDLRNRIVHYGKDTDEGTILGHLTKQERTDIILHYKFLIEQGEIFKKAYPENTKEKREHYLQVTQIEDYRAVRDVLQDELAEIKKKLHLCSREKISLQREISDHEKQQITLENIAFTRRDVILKEKKKKVQMLEQFEIQLRESREDLEAEVKRLTYELRSERNSSEWEKSAIAMYEMKLERAEKRIAKLIEEKDVLEGRINELVADNNRLSKLANVIVPHPQVQEQINPTAIHNENNKRIRLIEDNSIDTDEQYGPQ